MRGDSGTGMKLTFSQVRDGRTWSIEDVGGGPWFSHETNAVRLPRTDPVVVRMTKDARFARIMAAKRQSTRAVESL